MPQWIWIAVAGAVGTLCRWGLSLFVSSHAGGKFPWGTFVVNVLGCFVIGGVAAAIEKGSLVSPTVRLAITFGLLGGFTTFSSFALEGFELAARGNWVTAASYVLLTNSVGFAAVWSAHRLLDVGG